MANQLALPLLFLLSMTTGRACAYFYIHIYFPLNILCIFFLMTGNNSARLPISSSIFNHFFNSFFFILFYT
ncbi:unnamed protein product [Meloidogyne enterolobii]|uniref:Uncharacterized protein n=1 Tax=Meloidogyne enterolobii TaxID=390850 RepID=A0ACB0XPT0_MELEN